MRKDILKAKLEKLDRIKKSYMDPYPEKVRKDFKNKEVLKRFNEFSTRNLTLAGRIKSMRLMGSAAFVHIEDESGKIQLFLGKNDLAIGKYDLFVKTVEIGDFIQVSGKLFTTKAGEKTLKVFVWIMLAKNIRPIPVEHYGIRDIEEKLRKRYLDLMMNSETRDIFRKKNVFWQTIRQFLLKNDFLEVQTPVFENIPGGADAKPFITHHETLNRDFYLRISLELSLKRLLVGGYDRIFEIGRIFRNEGIDRDHLQEFDHMEFYASYWDIERGMKFSEKLFKKIIISILGSFISRYENNDINWSGKLPIIDYFIEFEKETKLDLNKNITVEELKNKADKLNIKYEKSYSKGRMIDVLYKKTVRPKLIQPCFLVGHPIEVSPLAKKDSKNPKKALRFQIVAGGSELCNAFSELNDPFEQRRRFEAQMKARKAGDMEAQMLDADFLEALEYGMPPAFGFGMSERLFAFLMNKSVRETVIFPPMKSK